MSFSIMNARWIIPRLYLDSQGQDSSRQVALVFAFTKIRLANTR